MSTISLSHTFHCPVLSREVDMSVEYWQPDGYSGNDYKRHALLYSSCDMYNDCTLKDKHDRCPVFLKFPSPYIR